MNRLFAARIAKLLANTQSVVVATCGPSGPTVCSVPFFSTEEGCWVRLTEISEHLFNLQQSPQIVLLADDWEMHGEVELPVPVSGQSGFPWEVVVRIQPLRLHLLAEDGIRRLETIDLDSMEPFDLAQSATTGAEQ